MARARRSPTPLVLRYTTHPNLLCWPVLLAEHPRASRVTLSYNAVALRTPTHLIHVDVNLTVGAVRGIWVCWWDVQCSGFQGSGYLG